jgi:hypothetical protein
MAPTFSTASANIGNQRLAKQIAEGRANPKTSPWRNVGKKYLA